MFQVKMSWHSSWAAKQKGNPTLLIIAGIGIIGGFFAGYKLLYKPWERRKTLHENEKFAKFLLEVSSEEE